MFGQVESSQVKSSHSYWYGPS